MSDLALRDVLDERTCIREDVVMPKVPKLSDQVRAAIDASGLSRYRIGKDLGIDEATLSRFMSGGRGLRMNVLDRLSVYLELRIVAGKRRRKANR